MSKSNSKKKSSKTSFQMQGGGAGERRVFRDELPGGFYEMHFRVGEVLKLLDVDGEFPKWEVRVKSVYYNGIWIHLDDPDTPPIFVPYENIREVIFQRHRQGIQKKKPKSATKKGGGRKKRRSPSPRRVKAAKKIVAWNFPAEFGDRAIGDPMEFLAVDDSARFRIRHQAQKKPKSATKKGGGRKKRRSPSPRRVKAAKKIQNYVRRRKSPKKKGGGRKSPSSKKSKFRMQGRGKWQQIVIKAVKAKKSPSSLPDIKKWITNNYDYNTSNPKNWPKLNKAKRELVEEKILTKVKGKFKISTKPSSPRKKKPKSATKKCFNMQDDNLEITRKFLDGKHFTRDFFDVGQHIQITFKGGATQKGYVEFVSNPTVLFFKNKPPVDYYDIEKVKYITQKSPKSASKKGGKKQY